MNTPAFCFSARAALTACPESLGVQVMTSIQSVSSVSIANETEAVKASEVSPEKKGS